VVSLFNGLQVIVIAIVAHATVSFGKNMLKAKRDSIIALLSATALILNANPFTVIMAAALAGTILYPIRGATAPSPTGTTAPAFKDALILSCSLFAGMVLFFLIDRALFDLALVMAKVELFAFGGGYTALTLLYHEVVEAHAWLNSRVFMDGVALGQVTPGPVLITAAFIGYLLKGVAGSLTGTIAMFTPGLLLITATLPFFDRLKASALFVRALKGIVTCFVGLLLFVTIKFALDIPWEIKRILLCAASFAAIYFKIDVLYVVIIGAAISVFIL
jgi:chromate transporter